MESMDDLDSISVDSDTRNQSNLDLLNYFDDAAFNQLTQSLDASPSTFDFNIAASSVRSGPVRSGPVRSGPVRSGPVRSGPVRSGLVRSGPVSGRGRGYSRIPSASPSASPSAVDSNTSASSDVRSGRGRSRGEEEPSRIITRSAPLRIRKAFRIVLHYRVHVCNK